MATPPARAAAPKRAVLILIPGVDSERLFRTLAQPEFQRLREGSGIALMNSSVPGRDTTESAYLTLGAGQRLPCPPGLTLVTPGAVGPDLQLDPTAVARIRSASKRSDAFPFALGTLLRQAGIAVRYQLVGGGVGDQVGPGALCAADDQGHLQLQQSSPRTLEAAGLLVLDFPAKTSPDLALRSAQEMLSDLDPTHDRLILTSPDPYPVVNGQWMRLSPVLIWGAQSSSPSSSGFPLSRSAGRGGQGVRASPASPSEPGARSSEHWLTSATTRTPGLLSNTDLTATLLDHFGVEAPARLEGHPARPSRPRTVQQLLGFAAQARANRDAMVPGLVGWGVLALVAVVLALTAVATTVPVRRAELGRTLVAATTFFPSAMLLTALLPTREPWQVLFLLAGITALLTALIPLLRRGRSPLLVPYVLLLSLLLLDLYLPTPMLARNLMSDFTNVGGRFYGIGNEYLGIVLGLAIAVPFWLLQSKAPVPSREGVGGEGVPPARPNPRTPKFEDDEDEHDPTHAPGSNTPHTHTPTHPHSHTPTLAALWLATLIGVGAPGMGADFGGAVSLALAFLYAGVRLTGQRLKVRHFLIGLAAAGAVALALVLFDLSRPPELRTHLGTIFARLFSGEAAAVGEMVLRKVMLNVEMALNGYFLIGMALVAPLIAFCYSRIGRNAGEALRTRPLARAGIYSILVGGVITALLNDTGVIAWALACGAALLWWLDLMLEDRYWNESCAR